MCVLARLLTAVNFEEAHVWHKIHNWFRIIPSVSLCLCLFLSPPPSSLSLCFLSTLFLYVAFSVYFSVSFSLLSVYLSPLHSLPVSHSLIPLSVLLYISSSLSLAFATSLPLLRLAPLRSLYISTNLSIYICIFQSLPAPRMCILKPKHSNVIKLVWFLVAIVNNLFVNRFYGIPD